MTVSSRVALCLASATLSLGCYTYVPAALDAVPVGAQVHAVLSTEREVALQDSLGISLRPLRGTLVEQGGGRELLSVRTAVGSRELGSQALYQRIGVAPQDVLRVDVRRLQPAKTAALVAGAALAATLVTLAALGKLSPGTPGNGGGGPPEQVRGW